MGKYAQKAVIQMWDKLLPWIGGIFAIIGLILIFFDVIASIKRRDKTKTNVVGLVFLSVAVVGYTITDLILKDSAWPPLASLIWIALFWVYVIMDACLTMGTIKKARRKRKADKLNQEQNTLTANADEQPVVQTEQDADLPTKKKRKK